MVSVVFRTVCHDRVPNFAVLEMALGISGSVAGQQVFSPQSDTCSRCQGMILKKQSNLVPDCKSASIQQMLGEKSQL